MEEKDNLNEINEDNKPIKILLMGTEGVGKTSIKSIIFENKTIKDTINLCSTNEIEETHLNFLNNIPITILDCCSKNDYSKQYFDTKKKIIFSNVGVLIFVFEAKIDYKKENENELKYFEK